MKKHLSMVLSSLLVFILFTFLFVPITNAEKSEIQYTELADQLKDLGLLQGGTNGYELDRAPTRLESGVMLIRLLGKEKEALAVNYNHPFNDVPNWGAPYVGYLYENGLTKGIGDNLFGSSSLIDTKSYVTFVLRALGYSDIKGDFTWNQSLLKGKEIGLLRDDMIDQLSSTTFLRDHMVYISYQALNKNLNNKEETLLDKLIAEGAVEIKVPLEEKPKQVEETSLLKLDPSYKESFAAIGKVQGLNGKLYYDGFFVGTDIEISSKQGTDIEGNKVTYIGTKDDYLIAEYDLSGQYQELIGVFSPIGTWEYNFYVITDIGEIKIYGDDNLLFESKLSSNQTIPIKLDITGVSVLRIEMNGEEILFANPIIK